MNICNEKMRILRVQLAAEKNKEKPNKKNIKILERELELCKEKLL